MNCRRLPTTACLTVETNIYNYYKKLMTLVKKQIIMSHYQNQSSFKETSSLQSSRNLERTTRNRKEKKARKKKAVITKFSIVKYFRPQASNYCSNEVQVDIFLLPVSVSLQALGTPHGMLLMCTTLSDEIPRQQINFKQYNVHSLKSK